MIERFVHTTRDFLMLRDTETKEIRYCMNDGRKAEEQWETAVPAKEIPHILEAYNLLRGRM